MSYVNVGVRNIEDHSDIPSKRALLALLATNPEKVDFYGTSDFTPFSGNGYDLVIGVNYQVTGPNPYTNRKWYATVRKTVDGRFTVK